MKEMGHGKHFYKPYVKIFFYSVLFGGGRKPWVKRILDSENKSLGMRPQEFRDSSEYNEIQAKAIKISGIMNLLPIIEKFRDMCNYVMKTYDKNIFFGPTGHEYPITESEFKRSFSNFLQSYEFVLLAESTIHTVEKFLKSELLFHFHDGNVIAVKVAQVNQFMEELNNQVKVR